MSHGIDSQARAPLLDIAQWATFQSPTSTALRTDTLMRSVIRDSN